MTPSTLSTPMDASTANERLASELPSASPRWARPAVAVLLLATTTFWTVTLSRNGWANAFYSAAAQAGTKSWKAMLFGSSDAANSITVDKPPASLWPMEISARIFGVNTWSLQLPQVLLGVASVALLYVIVKKKFGPAAGLIAGTALALTPVATLMFRFTNPDALLVFLMIAAVWALVRAVEDGRTRWLVLCGALIGLGFLTKQLQALLVVPGLALTYLIAGPPRLRIRSAQLMGGLLAMVAAAGWWVLLVELWPAEGRPYIGGSSNNSFLDLTFGYNGLGRLTGGESGMFPGGGGLPELPDAASGGFSPFGHPGIARMFTGESGGQISWLLPAALVMFVTGLFLAGRAKRTDADRVQYLVWGGWLLGTAGVFSMMSGLFHDYYTVALAPPIAALVGIGTVSLWRVQHKHWATAVLGGTIILTAAWSWILLGRTTEFVGWLRWVVLVAGVVAGAALMLAHRIFPRRNLRAWAGGLAIAAALAGPLAYCIQTVSTPHTGGVVTAGPAIPGGFPGPGGGHGSGAPRTGETQVSADLTAMLSAEARSYTWIAAVPGSTEAAYYQLATDDPVMALGGFGSGDPSPTLERFQDYVAQKRVHFYIESNFRMPIGGSGGSGAADRPLMPPGANADNEANRIKDWVKEHFTATTVDGVTLYDLTKPMTTN